MDVLSHRGLSSFHFQMVDDLVGMNSNFVVAKFCCILVGRPRSSVEAKLYQLENDIIIGGAIPDNFDVLHDDNFFVFDSGCTSSCSGSVRGATNL